MHGETVKKKLTEDWLSFNKRLWFLKLVYLFKTVLNYVPSMSQHCRYTRYKGKGKRTQFIPL